MRFWLLIIGIIIVPSFMLGQEDSLTLDEIIKAAQSHMDNIKTAKGKFKIQKTTLEKEGDKNDLIVGEWLYKDGHWRMRLEGKLWGTYVDTQQKELQKTNRSIATDYKKDVENKGDIDFDYIEKNRNASIQKKMISDNNISSYGLFFAGVVSANYFGTPINELLERVRNNTAKVSVHTGSDSSLIRLDIQYLNDNGELISEGFMEINPTRQYSILKYESCSVDKSYKILGNVEMELIQASNIYFTKKASFEIMKGIPLKTASKKIFEFWDTELNMPLTDQDLEIILPADVIVQDGLTQDIYMTKKDTSLKQILAGELEPILKKDIMSRD